MEQVCKIACIELIDWKPLRASYTQYSSNDYIIVKEMKIGQSAAKHPSRMKVQRLSLGKGVHLFLMIKYNLKIL